MSTIPANQSITHFWNAAAFSIPAAGTFGNAGRGILFGPAAWDADCSLMKDTAVAERVRLEFRAEVFNLFNHPTFAQPSGTVGTATFGQILNTFGSTLGFRNLSSDSVGREAEVLAPSGSNVPVHRRHAVAARRLPAVCPV
jgi:hypothetical protein